MMRVMLVCAHPVAESFHGALRARAIQALSLRHEVDLCDLYAERFDAVLSRDERLAYHDLTRNQELVAPYVERLRAAQGLVLMFPSWIFGPPAILKGFLDRVFLPGVSFSLDQGRVRPALRSIGAVAGVVTYGQTRWRAALMGDYPRKLVTRYLRRTTGAKSGLFLGQYDMNRASDAARRRFVETVGQKLARFG